MTDNKIQPEMILKALGHPSRLAIMRILLSGESYIELLASRLNLTPATVSHHVKILDEAGLLTSRRTQFYMIYSARREILGLSLLDLIGALPKNESDEYEKSVISTFFDENKLISLPSQRKKREIVLEEIMRRLPEKESFDENELSDLLEKIHPDYCLLRRSLIEFGFMTREDGVYYVKKEGEYGNKC